MMGTGPSSSICRAQDSFKKNVCLCVPALACVVPSLPFLKARPSVR